MEPAGSPPPWVVSGGLNPRCVRGGETHWSPTDGTARPPPDLDGFFHPTFKLVGLGCDDMALVPIGDWIKGLMIVK